MVDVVMRREFRLWAYGVMSAALAVAAVYGLVSGDEAQAWLLFASATLGLAIKNVPAAEQE